MVVKTLSYVCQWETGWLRHPSSLFFFFFLLFSSVISIHASHHLSLQEVYRFWLHFLISVILNKGSTVIDTTLFSPLPCLMIRQLMVNLPAPTKPPPNPAVCQHFWSQPCTKAWEPSTELPPLGSKNCFGQVPAPRRFSVSGFTLWAQQALISESAAVGSQHTTHRLPSSFVQ